MTGVSPHAPYTVHLQLLDRLVQIARNQHLPVAMHLAESSSELELLQHGSGAFRHLLEERGMWDRKAIPRASRPLDYLKRLALAPRALVIHGNYLDDEEISFLVSHNNHMSLVFCPRTHEYFGHDAYPLSRLLSAGVQVALGTDSRASNPDLSLVNEMRAIAASEFEVSRSSIVRMGTLCGAIALGLEDQVGSLTPGKWANLCALPCASGENPLDAILMSDTEPCHVFVKGIGVESNS